MYVEIHARSEVDDESTGKLMWVNADGLDIQLATTSPKHLGAPPWHIEIKGKNYLERSSGSRGGEYKGVIRTLEVQLTPNDLSTLLSLALAKGLLSVSITARDATSKQN